MIAGFRFQLSTALSKVIPRSREIILAERICGQKSSANGREINFLPRIMEKWLVTGGGGRSVVSAAKVCSSTDGRISMPSLLILRGWGS